MSNENQRHDLVQIGSRNGSQSAASGEEGLSRRGFLKMMGAASALGVAGCADPAGQKIFPLVKGPDDQIPGEAIWFASTCTECAAGCGYLARSIGGRTVKVEGNSQQPISRGGLCALGQSSLQALYDPDRVRQPLKRERGAGGAPVFKPISWDEAYKLVADALKQSQQNAIITREISGTMRELVSRWSESLNAQHVVYDALQPVELAHASEAVYGKYGIPKFHLNRAGVIVNFGADFLETWVSPVEYARQWVEARKKETPVRLVHIEPRLSLTGANADTWIRNRPGQELQIALAVLKLLLTWGKGTNLSADVRSSLQGMVSDIDVSRVASEAGISEEKLLLIAQRLNTAKSSLVLAGGAAASGSNARSLQAVCCFLNLVLANVGTTVTLAEMREPQTSVQRMRELVAALQDGQVGVVLVHSANPAFDLPGDYGFRTALRMARLRVSLSSQLDETAQLCDLVLPSHHSLEDWGDVVPHAGVYSLIQPTMLPVFDTRSLGDSLLTLATAVGKADVAEGAKNYQEFLKGQWQKLHAKAGASETFDVWFRECLKRGGYFEAPRAEERVRVNVNRAAFDLAMSLPELGAEGADADGPVLLPFPSVKTFDGRAANRPWMQELADPITQIVWDAWAEIHPSYAEKLGIRQGDPLILRNRFGELHCPAYLTEYIHPEVIAVPLGQGHSSFGRYAAELSQTGNAFELLPASQQGEGAPLLRARVNVQRGRGKAELVVVQGSNYQHDRELARTEYFEDRNHGDDHGDHHGHDDPKQMYTQREHPVYRWGMAIDLAACTGCSACVVACYAENNIPVVGKEISGQGREMSWLRIERYFGEGSGEEAAGADELVVNFLPMMCQHCSNAPCEPVCPVYATYHNEEGLNVMVYNRCVGTRYCSNNCSYKVRRFNWYEYVPPEPLNYQLNPNVVKRAAGVMEKCTFCVQRITEAKDRAKDLGRLVEDGEVQPACVQSCPTRALTFGNLNDPNSEVSKHSHDPRGYKVLDHHLNTQPAITYLNNLRYRNV